MTKQEALMVECVNRKVEAHCLSCKCIVHLCFEERVSRHWTHYECGRVHFGEQYEQSLVVHDVMDNTWLGVERSPNMSKTSTRAEEFYRPVSPYSRATKVNDGRVSRECAVRLYCEQSGSVWNLQVRTPMRLNNGREGKDFIVASAHMSLEDLRLLRMALDAHIRDAES